jgi:hypothetical protein
MKIMEPLIYLRRSEGKTKKIAIGLFAVLAVALFAPLVSAKPSQEDFNYWQDYYGWGPALFYGQNVKIHYLAVNTGVLNMKDNGDGTWTIDQELTQKGFAHIYDITGTTLLDTKNFRVIEITQGIVDFSASWYSVYLLNYIEKEEYHWIIPGVYHYHASIVDNDWDSALFEYWIRTYGWLPYQAG